MALNFQASTLTLTLPISCQICLGKVRQPVICANNHVFCSTCMEMWLKKASQCPTCRVPITAETPCREIIGGTNDSDHKESASTRKCLRKTRGELLFREYEDEIEGLIRDNEELKNKNQHLESQLKTALDPSLINTVVSDDKRVDSFILEELTKKLCAATDACEKVKQDMDRLKEANKALRSQNIDLVQENMRLKAEVASRSPQKFGRFTVAALESKIQQYERNIDQLKRALERSDQYIEELESRIKKPARKGAELQEPVRQRNTSGPEDFTQEQKINMMMRSLSDNERLSICSNPEADSRTFPQTHSLMFLPSGNHTEFTKTEKQKSEDLNGTSADLMPTTPSSAFRSLTLKSPGIREKKVAFKPDSYLRKLDFDDFPSPSKDSAAESQFICLDKLNPNTDEETKPAFWDAWNKSKPLEELCPGPSTQSPLKGAASNVSSDSYQMMSEASMDAAYLDKISELDSMMLDGESLSSRGSQLSMMSSPSTDLEATLVSETQSTSTFVPVQCGKDVLFRNKQDQPKSEPSDLNLPNKESSKVVNLPGESGEDGVGVQEGLSQSDELSFELLFDSLDDKDDASCQEDPNEAGCLSYCDDIPENASDRNTMNMIQATKRKSYSPFSTSSPTKLSKLM
ncbi:ORC ubiquitin ligase 1 [Eucyclogobius newberryi]|uniref:ORC ubiquitin ligase 1 n=1 Tax=Eucyclogobius newberryi TaxID=166745 RepID=UPI003B5A4764